MGLRTGADVFYINCLRTLLGTIDVLGHSLQAILAEKSVRANDSHLINLGLESPNSAILESMS